jgi:hypothetical protein
VVVSKNQNGENVMQGIFINGGTKMKVGSQAKVTDLRRGWVVRPPCGENSRFMDCVVSKVEMLPADMVNVTFNRPYYYLGPRMETWTGTYPVDCGFTWMFLGIVGVA